MYRLNFNQLLEKVSSFYGIPSKEILGKSRAQEIIRARFALIYLCRVFLEFSYPDIGNYVGGRDHTSAMHGYQKIKLELEQNTYDANQIQKLINELEQGDLSIKQKTVPEVEKVASEVVLEELVKKNEVIKANERFDYIENLTPEYLARINHFYQQWKNGLTYQQIAESAKLSRQRIDQLINRAIDVEIYNLIKNKIEVDVIEFKKSLRENYKGLRRRLNKKPKEVVNKKPKVYRWSKYYDQCLMCKTSAVKHRSNGYCRDCYSKSQIFKECQVNSRLRNSEKWKERSKKYRLEYQKRPEIIEKHKKMNDELNFGGNRIKALERDRYKCTNCDLSFEESKKIFNRDLYVVHLNDRDNHSLENLKTFCYKCHSERMMKIMRTKKNNK